MTNEQKPNLTPASFDDKDIVVSHDLWLWFFDECADSYVPYATSEHATKCVFFIGETPYIATIVYRTNVITVEGFSHCIPGEDRNAINTIFTKWNNCSVSGIHVEVHYTDLLGVLETISYRFYHNN